MKDQIVRFSKMLFLAFTPFIFMFTGCPDPCENFECVNGTKLVDASEQCDCICNTGYTGVHCEDLITTTSIDSVYEGIAHCDPNNYLYAITVFEGPGAGNLTFINIHDTGDTAYATILSGNTFNITFQPYGSGSISGSGEYLAGDHLYLDYEIYTTSGAEYCSFNYP